MKNIIKKAIKKVLNKIILPTNNYLYKHSQYKKDIDIIFDKINECVAIQRWINNKELFNNIFLLLQPMIPRDIELVLIGSRNAFSFGIANDVSWDTEIANKGIQVYQFDPTITNLPSNHTNFHFYKIGVSGKNAATPPYIDSYKYFSLKDLYNKYTPNDNNVILKMDIEGFEYATLFDAKDIMHNFYQIVLEAHDLNSPQYGLYFYELLKMFHETHQLIHVHGNNCGFGVTIDGKTLPGVIELTFLRKDNHFFNKSNMLYPLSIDQRNVAQNYEIILGNLSKNYITSSNNNI